MPEHIKNIEQFTDEELELKLADEIIAMESFTERPGYKPAAFWTHEANTITIGQQLSRRKNGY